MMSDELKKRLGDLVKGGISLDEPLSDHSTMKIGGTADAFVVPSDVEDLICILKFAKREKINIFVLGAGSNILFRDDGFEGIIINTARLTNFEVKESDDNRRLIQVEAGFPVKDMVSFSVSESLTGFECLAGIPGTVGGALSMNAGTHNGTISDLLVNVTAVDKAGRIYTWPKDKIEFSYRYAKYPRSGVILSSEFLLQKGASDEINNKVNELRERRKSRHPLKWPSLGSVFKNPRKGPSAGELIDEVGLKGVRVGGARVSSDHGNWIINEGNATSKDVEVLIHLVREKVKEAEDISLEPEIVVVGKKKKLKGEK